MADPGNPFLPRSTFELLVSEILRRDLLEIFLIQPVAKMTVAWRINILSGCPALLPKVRIEGTLQRPSTNTPDHHAVADPLAIPVDILRGRLPHIGSISLDISMARPALENTVKVSELSA